MKCPFKIKVCTRCKRILVAYEGNFTKNCDGKFGFKSICKKCYKEERREEWFKDNPFNDIDPDKVWNHCPFVIIKCTKCGKILVWNNMNFYRDEKRRYGLSYMCKQCSKNKGRKWEKNNKERRKETSKKYREDNPEKIFNNNIARRLREESQGRGITKEQWLEMMQFFEWKCAYSGEKFSNNNKENDRSIDHIVPLSKGGENEIWNCVPIKMNYNSSKNANDMLEWYKQQEFYSEERLNKIYEWIEYAKDKWR